MVIKKMLENLNDARIVTDDIEFIINNSVEEVVDKWTPIFDKLNGYWEGELSQESIYHLMQIIAFVKLDASVDYNQCS